MSGDDQAIDPWSLRLPGRLDFLLESELADEDVLDFSAGSLGVVEQYVLDRFESVDDLAANEEGERFAEGAAVYVGEALLRLAGGGWVFGGDPRIEADPALALPALAPLELVLTAVRERTGDQFAGAWRDWERAVQRYQAQHPGWAPRKQPTVGVDPVPQNESETRYLSNWLAEREAAFPRWVAEYGEQIVWDFSARSLDQLGSLVLRRTPSVAALDDPRHGDFVSGAEWYIGETLRRVRGGSWHYYHGDPEFHLFAGHPYVTQSDPDGEAAVPHVALKAMVEPADPHYLRDRYEAFEQ